MMTPIELERLIQAVAPDALLVPGRILRRIIKHLRNVAGIGLKVPHRKSFVVESARLLEVADWTDLGVEESTTLPHKVLLIARPDAERLAATPVGLALLKYWQRLFHARIHFFLEERQKIGALSPAVVRQRIEALGQTRFDEIRDVLRQDEYTFADDDDTAVYVEFAAVFLELRHFAPSLLEHVFPSLDSPEQVEQILAEDLDAACLLAETKLNGSPDPVQFHASIEEQAVAELWSFDEPAEELPSQRRHDRIAAKARKAAAVGNCVRAASLWVRASRLVSRYQAVTSKEAAQAQLRRLARRLQTAISLTESESRDWLEVMGSLLERSSAGFWNRATRILYDLQKVCVDHEREVYTIDVMEWILSRGKRPIRRTLAGQREVLIHKHLRSAARRLRGVRMDESTRRQFAGLLGSAIHSAELRLRDLFRPRIGSVLVQVGMNPRNGPETIARAKIIEELLDELVERGFLTMGSLRDSVSRNQLKLPDLTKANDYLAGDELLRSDRALRSSLDGVYHRGPLYLRIPQRISSLFFGTALGRILVRFAAVPFGGAFVVLSGLQHLAEFLTTQLGTKELHFVHPWTVVAWGLFATGLINSSEIRRDCLSLLRYARTGLRIVCIDLPRGFYKLPAIRAFLQSKPARLFGRFILKPSALTGLIWLIYPPFLRDLGSAILSGVAAFILSNLMLNSRVGRDLEEFALDILVRGWHKFRFVVLAVLFHVVMDFFNRLVDGFDRLLYTVDELLCFRTGQSPLSTLTKAVLGVIWFFISYVVRFALTLLIEPQINPIKHFPVVTVSHKLILPMGITTDRHLPSPLTSMFQNFVPISTETGNWISAIIVLLIPGIFGFLAWELMNNWRLYAANRSRTLKPAMVGSHGETVPRLLRPGFHSGTIRKIFAKWRKSGRRSYWSGNKASTYKHRQSLEHARHEVAHFVERDFLSLLSENRSCAALQLALQYVKLGTNNIRVGILAPDLGESLAEVTWQMRNGWLVARISQAKLLEQIPEDARFAFGAALAGFYKLAGVDLVVEQFEAHFSRDAVEYEIDERGMVLYPNGRLNQEVIFPHRPTSSGDASNHDPAKKNSGLESSPERFLFSRGQITWQDWVDVWSHEQLGEGIPAWFQPAASVLPKRIAQLASERTAEI